MPHPDPYQRLSDLAIALGWHDLRVYHHTISDQRISTGNARLTWYETGESDGKRTDFFLQINEYPPGQDVSYCGAV